MTSVNLSPFEKERIAHEKVLNFLKNNITGLTTTDIGKGVQISRKTLEKHLQLLVREGEIYVKEHGPVRVYYPHVYKTLKSEKLKYDNRIIWFDLVQTQNEKFLLIKKKREIKGKWIFENSMKIPVMKIAEFYKIIGRFK